MRVRRSLAAVAVGLLLVGSRGSSALAHEPGTTAILIEVGVDSVDVRLDVPVDRLEIALDTELDTDRFSLSQERELIVGYVTDHLDVRTSLEAVPWDEQVEQLTAISIDGLEYLRLAIRLDPQLEPGATVPGAFTIAADPILATDETHEIFVTVTGLPGDATDLVGVIDSGTATLTVGADGADGTAATFVSMIGRGFDHVLEGADHLLFLVVLLLPAPLLVVGGRWSTSTSGRGAVTKVALVASAFTVGHSATLIASALGWISLPRRPVEVLVAVSVAVAAVHVLRPLATRGEELIAGTFGLIHGLAFSGLVNDLGLGRTTSLASLFGFNVGIEAAQLLVIAVAFPSLWALSRTGAYRAVRFAGAGLALLGAGGWVVDRIGLANDPFVGIEDAIVGHLPLVGFVLAAVAAAATAGHRTFGPGGSEVPRGAIAEWNHMTTEPRS